jgi:hypothetical protein
MVHDQIEAELRGMTPGREPASSSGRSSFLVWTTQLCLGDSLRVEALLIGPLRSPALGVIAVN